MNILYETLNNIKAWQSYINNTSALLSRLIRLQCKSETFYTFKKCWVVSSAVSHNIRFSLHDSKEFPTTRPTSIEIKTNDSFSFLCFFWRMNYISNVSVGREMKHPSMFLNVKVWVWQEVWFGVRQGEQLLSSLDSVEVRWTGADVFFNPSAVSCH